MKWYKKVVLENYANFTGRARRKEYWMFILFNVIFAIVAMVLDKLLGIGFAATKGMYGPIYLIYGLAVLIPGLAALARRLHDTGRSGWWLLLFLTLIGVILLIVWAIFDSQPGENKYGTNPKGA